MPASQPPPVWPHREGNVRGVALFDALRAGAARERKMASELLAERLA